MYSMFLVPKRLYYSLIKNIEDDETKKELIAMNENPETTNYIENAIKFKNLLDRQKINQTGDKLLRFGPDKLPNVTSVTQSDSMGRTYQYPLKSPSAQIPQQEEIPNVMPPDRVTQIGSSVGPTYQPVLRPPSAQIPQQEEVPNVMSPGRVAQTGSSMGPTYQPVSKSPLAQIPQQEEMLSPNRVDSSMDVTNASLYRTPVGSPQQKESNLPIKRQSDAEKSLSPEKSKSPNKSVYSTKQEEWQETPVAEAMTRRNSKGKLVCPIPDCFKQYVDETQLGKHLLKDHPKDIALKEKKTIKGMISSPYARTNSPNEMDYSYTLSEIKSPVVLKWRNTPIAKAVKEKNAAGKIVCPFPGCGKQYVGIPQFSRHMMRIHYKQLSVRNKKKIFQMTSTPLKRRSGNLESSYPSFPLTPVKIRYSVGKHRSKGATKGPLTPLKTRFAAGKDRATNALKKSFIEAETPARIRTRSKTMKMFKSRSPTKRNSAEAGMSPTAGMSPAKTGSKSRKMSKSESIKKRKIFIGKYPKL